jgi:threonine dehydrogenase-like Zn-dependent dehydrogenase
MQALYYSANHLQYLSDHPDPSPAAAEALIRVSLAGICSTDLEITRGYADFTGILGHEFVGVVEACAETSWLGRRVVGSINLGCHQCAVCQGEGPEHCSQRTVLGIIKKDGVFADFVTLPIANLLTVPDSVSDELAVFTEPLAAALRIREQVTVKPSARTAVVGPGRLGLLIGQVLSLAGTEVTMIGRRVKSLALPAQLGLKTGLLEEFGDDSFDLVVEATGNATGFTHSMRLVRPRGTLILKSTFSGKADLDLTKLVVGEINVVGSRCGPFGPALRLLAERAVEVEALIEAEYPLAHGLEAMEHASQPGVRKVLLRP